MSTLLEIDNIEIFATKSLPHTAHISHVQLVSVLQMCPSSANKIKGPNSGLRKNIV